MSRASQSRAARHREDEFIDATAKLIIFLVGFALLLTHQHQLGIWLASLVQIQAVHPTVMH
ncbi:MAG TPA: hypothetical protein VNL35_10115 [Chloroflexota bacterium]|nr:hypothetical protein [Chloroflexota bacterium]